MTYSDKLKDPRWQKRRLELLNQANFTCGQCDSKTNTLHVHHGLYRKGVEPWDYEDAVMHVLCEACHEKAEAGRRLLYEHFATIEPYILTGFANWIGGVPPTPGLLAGIIKAFGFFIQRASVEDEWPVTVTDKDIVVWLRKQTGDELAEIFWHEGYGTGLEEARTSQASLAKAKNVKLSEHPEIVALQEEIERAKQKVNFKSPRWFDSPEYEELMNLRRSIPARMSAMYKAL